MFVFSLLSSLIRGECLWFLVCGREGGSASPFLLSFLRPPPPTTKTRESESEKPESKKTIAA
jgi:hypothetical protein